MSIPDRDGRFKAYPVRWTVCEKGESKLATFVCEFRTTLWWSDQDDQWYSLDGEITGFFYLEKKDGNLNEFAINSLRDALGWDGRDLSTLDGSDWSHTEVQLSLGYETYNGKERLKVQFINAADWEPTGMVENSDPAVVKSLNNRLGSKLRANAGPTSHTNNAPPPARKPSQAAKSGSQTTGGHVPIDESDIPF